MECYHLESFPTEISMIFIALFSPVQNCAQLRTRLVTASKLEGAEGELEREAVNYCFLNPKMIVSRAQLQSAIFQSLIAYTSSSGLSSKTIHSEILLHLSPSPNLIDALKSFGVSETSDALLMVRVGSPDLQKDDVLANMKKLVGDAELVSLDQLSQFTDKAALCKALKVDPTTSSEQLDRLASSIPATKFAQ